MGIHTATIWTHFGSVCVAMKRAQSKTEHSGDQILNFYIQTMDSLYFCANRSVEAGFRCKPSTQQEEKQNDDKLFDAEFARISSAIRKSDLLTQAFERINGQNNS